jgi:phosphohistidine phosphatase SixA
MTDDHTLSTRRRFVTAAAATGVAFVSAARAQDGGAPAPLTQAVEPIDVFVLRHAEKGAGDPQDPELSEAGTARAGALARLLGAAGVTHLFASEFRRTQHTLAPLAAALGLEVVVAPARDVDALAARIAELPNGSVVVVCGHSNTTPQLVDRLVRLGGAPSTAAPRPNLAESEFDRVFHTTLVPSPIGSTHHCVSRVIELRYGEST